MLLPPKLLESQHLPATAFFTTLSPCLLLPPSCYCLLAATASFLLLSSSLLLPPSLPLLPSLLLPADLTRYETSLIINWGSSGPAGLPVSTYWAARFTAYLKIPAEGTANYTFLTNADDVIRLYVDGQFLGGSRYPAQQTMSQVSHAPMQQAHFIHKPCRRRSCHG